MRAEIFLVLLLLKFFVSIAIYGAIVILLESPARRTKDNLEK